MKVTVHLMKESGKYYTTEILDVSDTAVYDVPDKVNSVLQGRYRGMHAVILSDEPDMYPMMVPAHRRL